VGSGLTRRPPGYEGEVTEPRTDTSQPGNALLDAVVQMVTDLLRRRGFSPLAPVRARFRTAENGSTGVVVAVRLEDPSHADPAKSAIAERFPDPLSEVIVS
jgi:hypothetical protein